MAFIDFFVISDPKLFVDSVALKLQGLIRSSFSLEFWVVSEKSIFVFTNYRLFFLCLIKYIFKEVAWNKPIKIVYFAKKKPCCIHKSKFFKLEAFCRKFCTSQKDFTTFEEVNFLWHFGRGVWFSERFFER